MDPLKLTQSLTASTGVSSARPVRSSAVPQSASAFADVLASLARARSSVDSAEPNRTSKPGSNPIFGNSPSLPTFHERALALRGFRQELLASNIANADTPGYKAVDIDIKKMITDGVGLEAKTVPQYVIPSQASGDANTVDMDRERAEFAQNALLYEYEVDRVKGRYKSMQDLLSNLPY